MSKKIYWCVVKGRRVDLVWNKPDKVFVCAVSDMPSIMTHGDTMAEALDEMELVLA
jgi:predicted RNase H-like HicB family nuclease